MYWADGSIYRGQWGQGGIQNGLGIMIFANGTRKAGFFNDNVLVELLTDHNTVNNVEGQLDVPFPESFRQELKEYIGLMNPKEDNRQYLDKKFQDAGVEDKIAPNTLLEMQDIANAPWEAEGAMTRDDYIAFVKNQEL